MTTTLKVRNGEIHRHDRVDHAVGDKVRRQHRDMAETGKRRDGNDPFNEAFTFSAEEYALFQRIRPELFDQSLDPFTRRQHWADFANSSIGRSFRVR